MKKIAFLIMLTFCFAFAVYSQTVETDPKVELKTLYKQIELTEKKKAEAEYNRARLLVQYTNESAEVKAVEASINFAKNRLTKLIARKNELEKTTKVDNLPNDEIELLKEIVRQNQRIIELLKSKNSIELSELLSDEILLTDDETIVSLNDFGDKIIVLTFIEAWSGPAKKTAKFLDEFKSKNPNENLQIIAVSIENTAKERAFFKRYVDYSKLSYKTGWAGKLYAKEFMKMANFQGNPVSFVIRDREIHGMFVGSAPKTHKEIADLLSNMLKDVRKKKVQTDK